MDYKNIQRTALIFSLLFLLLLPTMVNAQEQTQHQLYLPLLSGSSSGDLASPTANFVSAAIVAPAALVAEWQMDEDFSDSGTNGLNGTPINGVATVNTAPAVTGDPGTCHYGTFNGSNQFVNVPYDAQLNPNDFTVSLWARVDGGNGSWRSPITSRWEDSSFQNQQGYIVYAGADNNWHFWTGNGGGWDILTGPAVNNGTWTHIAISFETTSVNGDVRTGTKKLYVNGTVAAEQTGAYRSNVTGPVTIGAGGGAGNQFHFNGAIDEATLYNTALSDGDVQQLNNAVHTCSAAPTNNAPTISTPGNQTTVEGDSVNLAISASDADGDTLSYSASGLPTGLVINSGSGVVAGTASAAGSYNATITVNDGNGGIDSESFTWTVNGSTTEATVIVPTTIVQTAGDTLGGYDLDHLIDGSGLSTTPTVGNITSVSHAGGAQNLWVTASALFPNHYTGGGVDPVIEMDLGGTQTLSAMVVWGYGGNANEASNFTVEFSTNEGATYGNAATVQTNSLLNNASATLSFGAPRTANKVRVTMTNNANRRGFGGPGGDRVGLGEIRFIGGGGTTGNNNPPALTNLGSRSNTVGDNVNLAISASDADGDTLSYSASGLPTGLVINSGSGVIAGTASAAGSYNATITVNDGNGGIDSESFTWTVNGSTTEATVIVPTTIVQTAGDTLGGYDLDHLIDGSGLSTTPTVGNITSVSHAGGAQNLWVTASALFPNYYTGGGVDPVIEMDLGGTQTLSAMVVWGYGGNANEASNFTVEFSTNEGATYGDAATVQTNSLLNNASATLSFGAPRTANKVRVTMTNNADGRGFGGPGGDRVGLGEIRFISEDLTPPNNGQVELLLVSSHADDEGIFGGGILPYYAQVRNSKVVALTMVTRNGDGSYPITTGATSRVQELRNANDVYAGQTIGSGSFNGLGHYITGNITLVEGGFIDTGCCSSDPGWSWNVLGNTSWGSTSQVTQLTPGFGNMLGMSDGRTAAARVIAREIRRYRPRIVATVHDLEGDYGHSNHAATSIATIEAYDLAADPNVDIDGLPAWQAEKLYLRGSGNDNRYSGANPNNNVINWHGFSPSPSLHSHFHDHMEASLIAGQSARYFADLGVDQHFSQGAGTTGVVTVFSTDDPPQFDGNYSEWWTLYKSTVGGSPVSNFSVAGDTTGTNYVGWSRGHFAE